MGISIDKMYGNSIIQLKSLIKIQDDSNIEIQFKYCFQTQELKEWKKKKKWLKKYNIYLHVAQNKCF